MAGVECVLKPPKSACTFCRTGTMTEWRRFGNPDGFTGSIFVDNAEAGRNGAGLTLQAIRRVPPTARKWTSGRTPKGYTGTAYQINLFESGSASVGYDGEAGAPLGGL